MQPVTASVNPSIFSFMNSYGTLGERAFFKEFGWEKAIMVGTDECEFSGDESITSFDIGDCITLFAMEKDGNKNECLTCWHIDAGTSLNDLMTELDANADQFDFSKKHDFYIVGGKSHTVEGEDCLLQHIRNMIIEKFPEGSKIKLEMLNPDSGKAFVSANLQLDGTLTVCFHNTSHM